MPLLLLAQLCYFSSFLFNWGCFRPSFGESPYILFVNFFITFVFVFTISLSKALCWVLYFFKQLILFHQICYGIYKSNLPTFVVVDAIFLSFLGCHELWIDVVTILSYWIYQIVYCSSLVFEPQLYWYLLRLINFHHLWINTDLKPIYAL